MNHPGLDVVAFGRALRAAGLAIGLDQLESFARGLELVDIMDRRAIYLAARTTLVTRHEDLAGEAVRIVVVLDACNDFSGVIARAYGVQTLTLKVRNVGIARATGADLLLAEGARWLAFTSGWNPESHALASCPGAKNASCRYFRRSGSGSEGSAHLFTASASASGYRFAAAARIATPRTSSG